MYSVWNITTFAIRVNTIHQNNQIYDDVCRDGRPSIRIVGVKGFDKTGFQILTNQNSKKAKDLVSVRLELLIFVVSKTFAIQGEHDDIFSSGGGFGGGAGGVCGAGGSPFLCIILGCLVSLQFPVLCHLCVPTYVHRCCLS